MKKPKAYLMILILISSIFTISLINPTSVSAQDDFCCEKTVSGEFCKYTQVSNCDNNYNAVPASCSYTDFCKTGCCVFDEFCSENMPKSACENSNGVWSSTSCNDVEQCDVGCCVLGQDYIFTTETKCQTLHEPFPYLEYKFRKDLTSESSCLNLALEKQEGCCKVDENTCNFGTRSECLQITNDEKSFYNNIYCSDPQLGCSCEPKAEKACLPNSDDVYWFDSCGNPEGVAEECNYDAGTTCGEKNNLVTCISTDCTDPVYGNKRNGESWCEFDEFDDEEALEWTGSRHYLRSCVNGKIIYEECADYRQEICIQSTAADGKSEAKCIVNKDSEGNTILPPGGRFWEGIPSCSVANGIQEFGEDDDSAQQQWTNQKYLECANLGDCGNKENWIGNYSSGGYTNNCKTESQEVVDERKTKYKSMAQSIGGLAGGLSSVFAILIPVAWIAAPLAIIAVAALVITMVISGIKDEDTKNCIATCSAWTPPIGGDCSKCTEDPNKPCTGYRCKSLGASCDIINENTPFVNCAELKQDDGLSPVISPLNKVLSKGITLSSTQTGYKLNEGVPSYQAVTFGIKTDEPTQCKVSSTKDVPFENMISYFGENLYLEEHELTIAVPKEFTDIQNKFNLYVKCQDKFGNDNKADYSIELTILPGPDLTAPVIELTNLEDNIQIPTHLEEVDFSVYLNEPAECRYSTTTDTVYDQMPFTFDCATSFNEISPVSYGLYECKTKLTQIEHSQDRTYYIKCRDQPTAESADRNTNSESYIFTTKATQSLIIEEKSPEGPIFTNNPTLLIRTSGGSENGIAECGFTDKVTLPYIKFYKTGLALHEQNLENLEKRTYAYFIKCTDSAGNIAEDKIEFNVASDSYIPIIQSIVTNNDFLTLTLNEEATCEYSDSSFTFGSGTLTATDSITHSLPSQDILYIICKDTSGNDASFTLYI